MMWYYDFRLIREIEHWFLKKCPKKLKNRLFTIFMLDTWPHVINSIALSHDTVYLSIPDVLDVQKVQLNLMLLHICMKY